MSSPKIAASQQSPLPQKPARLATEASGAPATHELPLEDIYALDPESLIAYCEQRRHLPASTQPVTWRQAVVLGTAATCAVALVGYQIYQGNMRSAARAIRAVAPPPFVPHDGDDTEPF